MNLDVTFEDEDLTLMLLGSLPKKFEFLETTLLHGKVAVSLSEVMTALYSHEMRSKAKEERIHEAAEALVTRGRSQNWSKGKKGRSKSRPKVGIDECTFCHEKGHWKKVINALKHIFMHDNCI